ncbi:hypothetical protein Cob_v009636 [Colletotrichum orbiculare MAFF 240422]|uniref:Uncharacterized protein n=1 Tax=Colletotrichum orbiculare (strain 104-T / ATCC 96160 / CBS 514.97 / LARS 414 / MAFF 240422) TaxID=1213857 RepID=A0A484FJD1_COLOR|nr:hypothetical protein Cob_v009636 [Colletotrichum orbiculare MAFF 240422]
MHFQSLTLAIAALGFLGEAFAYCNWNKVTIGDCCYRDNAARATWRPVATPTAAPGELVSVVTAPSKLELKALLFNFCWSTPFASADMLLLMAPMMTILR